MSLWRYDDMGMDCWGGWGVRRWTDEYLASKDQNELEVEYCNSFCTPAFPSPRRRTNVSGFDICLCFAYDCWIQPDLLFLNIEVVVVVCCMPLMKR